MTCVRRLIDPFLVGSTLRFAITGVVVALLNLVGPVALNAGTGLAIEACIPIVYLLALCLHFTSQRVFVWRHAAGFHLDTKQQVWRYLASAATQYGLVAGLTAVLPGLLGWPQGVVYVVVALAVAILFFLFLRGFVFHARRDQTDPATAGTDPGATPGDAPIPTRYRVTNP